MAYLPSHKAAVGCIRYLLDCTNPLDKMAFKLSCDMGRVKNWLKTIDEGQVSRLSIYNVAMKMVNTEELCKYDHHYFEQYLTSSSNKRVMWIVVAHGYSFK